MAAIFEKRGITINHIIAWLRREAVLTAAFVLALILVLLCFFSSMDYSLLLTFLGFFIFVGNMGCVPSFRVFLERVVTGHEVLTAILTSQIISNVPTALLLSEFTENIPALIVGTNLGGLGTLIASMASLISYKQFAQKHSGEKAAYLRYFTVANLVFLAVLAGLRAVLNR
jgi:hypothetical protein